MSVKLEKYLRMRRNDLDVETPDEMAVWEGIKKGLNNEHPEIKRLNTRIKLLRIRNLAATAIILFALGYIANDIVNRKITKRDVTLSSINTELGRKENDYKSLILYKTEEVRSFATSDDKIINQLFSEIKDLDLIYDQAMKDLRELGPDEKVVNTIFSTYEQKIRLLELIILESNKINSHEKNDKTIL